MKKLIFVCSHLHSGSSALCEILNEHPRIQICKNFQNQNYYSPLDLFYVTSNNHKLNNKSALYLDHLLFNFQMSMKAAYSYCRFIYVIRNPEPVINFLIKTNNMDINHATRYYTYRLRRIYEMSKNTPDFVLLTWQELINGDYCHILENYLDLNHPLDKNLEKFVEFDSSDSVLSSFELSSLDEKYQKYLYRLKNQNIIFS